MKMILSLSRRNIKLFFKDKGLFFTSLITPMILLVLFISFLGEVYRDSYVMGLPDGVVSEALIDALVGGQLVSSLLAVACVTVSFCSNMLMVQDKVKGQRKDFSVTPCPKSSLSISYFASTFFSTLLILLVAFAAGSIYLISVGWYLGIIDVFLILSDIIILVLFGTALSSLINLFLSSQGQISAVGTIISSCYGFISGAYMPISQFGEGLRNFIALLPGTYGTSLLRNHYLTPVFDEIKQCGLSDTEIKILADITDCNIYFGDVSIGHPLMYTILCGTVLLLIILYVLLSRIKDR